MDKKQSSTSEPRLRASVSQQWLKELRALSHSCPAVIDEEKDQGETAVFHPLARTVLSVLEHDLYAADAKLAFWIRAVNSYRWEDMLVPFPPMADKSGHKDINLLIQLCLRIPALPLFIDQLRRGTAAPDILELFHWLFVTSDTANLRTLEHIECERLNQTMGLRHDNPRPKHIFEISQLEDDGEFSPPCFTPLFSFYRSPLEDFHYIMNCGFENYMTSKDTIDVEPLRLYAPLSEILPTGTGSSSWGKSICGEVVHGYLLCEVTPRPDFLKIAFSAANPLLQKTIVGDRALLRPRFLVLFANTFNESAVAERSAAVALPGEEVVDFPGSMVVAAGLVAFSGSAWLLESTLQLGLFTKLAAPGLKK